MLSLRRCSSQVEARARAGLHLKSLGLGGAHDACFSVFDRSSVAETSSCEGDCASTFTGGAFARGDDLVVSARVNSEFQFCCLVSRESHASNGEYSPPTRSCAFPIKRTYRLVPDIIVSRAITLPCLWRFEFAHRRMIMHVLDALCALSDVLEAILAQRDGRIRKVNGHIAVAGNQSTERLGKEDPGCLRNLAE